MNPFEDNNDNIQETIDYNVIIWVEANGNKRNTYISGWNIPEQQLKDHLKMIKKKNGCNGCIKSLPNESNNGFISVLQLQGDHIDFVKDYLIKHDVCENNINIKG